MGQARLHHIMLLNTNKEMLDRLDLNVTAKSLYEAVNIDLACSETSKDIIIQEVLSQH